MFQWFSLHYSLVVCFALTLPPEREFTLQTLVFTLTYVFFTLEPTWNQPGTNLGPTWDQPGTNQNQPGTNLEPTWDQPGTNLVPPGLTRHQPGTNLEPTWNQPGTTVVLLFCPPNFPADCVITLNILGFALTPSGHPLVPSDYLQVCSDFKVYRGICLDLSNVFLEERSH
jgi:hypothetical protein